MTLLLFNHDPDAPDREGRSDQTGAGTPVLTIAPNDDEVRRLSLLYEAVIGDSLESALRRVSIWVICMHIFRQY